MTEDVPMTADLREACEQYERDLAAYHAGTSNYPSTANIYRAIERARRGDIDPAPEGCRHPYSGCQWPRCGC